MQPQSIHVRAHIRCIAKKDFRGMTKDVLPTPCMVVDIDLFEKNLKTMADFAKTAPIQLRPHVKVHKSVDIAKRQMALGQSVSLRPPLPNRN